MRRSGMWFALLCALLLTATDAGAEYYTAEDGTRYVSAGQENGDGWFALQSADEEGVEAVVDGVRYTLLSDSTATRRISP